MQQYTKAQHYLNFVIRKRQRHNDSVPGGDTPCSRPIVAPSGGVRLQCSIFGNVTPGGGAQCDTTDNASASLQEWSTPFVALPCNGDNTKDVIAPQCFVTPLCARPRVGEMIKSWQLDYCWVNHGNEAGEWPLRCTTPHLMWTAFPTVSSHGLRDRWSVLCLRDCLLSLGCF